MANIRESRPRCFLTPESLAALRARYAAGDASGKALLDWCKGYTGTTRHYAPNYALLSLCTGEAKWARRAVEIALKAAAAPLASVTEPRGLYLAEYIVPVALVYDWCHAALTADEKPKLLSALVQWASWAWPETNPSRKGQWAVDNPGSNMYWGFMSSWLAGLAVDSGAVDIARKRFEDQVRPYLATVGRGGYWLEGMGYGTLSSRYMFWWLAAHLSATGEDLLNSTPFCAEYVRMLTHNTTPDGKRLVPWGAQSGYREAMVRDWEASPMRVASSLLKGNPAADAADWLEWTGATAAKELLWEHLLWPGLTAPQERIPDSYHAEGGGVIAVSTDMNRRDASMLAAICGPDQEGHADRAAGDFLLWAGGEWLVTSPKVHIGNGVNTQATQYHNVILVDGRGIEAPDSTLPKPPGKIHAFRDDDHTARILMEAGGAYHRRKWPQPERVLDYWWREILWHKPGFFLVSDQVRKMREEQVITWAIHLPYEPKLVDGQWEMQGKNATLVLEYKFFGNHNYQWVVEKLPDTTMGGPGCWRLKRIAPAGKLTDEFNCLLQVRL